MARIQLTNLPADDELDPDEFRAFYQKAKEGDFSDLFRVEEKEGHEEIHILTKNIDERDRDHS